MLKTFMNAIKIKDIRKRLYYTFGVLIIVRIGSLLPLIGIDREFVADQFADFSEGAFGFFDAITGGSFSNMSLFALSITPYITASIIMQLLTIAIPKLEELQKEGEDGRKKIAEYTRYLTVALALVESAAMAIGFGRRGLFGNVSELTEASYNAQVILAILTMTAGSAILMWLGERITEKGVGNGISIILMINIVARIPEDFVGLYQQFVRIDSSNSRSIGGAGLAALIILAIVIAVVVFVVVLQGGERRIPVQYAKKMQGRKMIGGQSSHIPLKVNTAGVIPIIFAQSLLSFPTVIAQLTGNEGTEWSKYLSQNNWIDPNNLRYSVGFLVNVLLIVFFAYFYTSITFNPLEIANNMKKQGGFIPGIRPGKPTSDYLSKILGYIIFMGAVGLVIVITIPIVAAGIFGAHVSFGGTSLIIIVGVIIETMKKIEAMMLVRNYKGFLNE